MEYVVTFMTCINLVISIHFEFPKSLKLASGLFSSLRYLQSFSQASSHICPALWLFWYQSSVDPAPWQVAACNCQMAGKSTGWMDGGWHRTVVLGFSASVGGGRWVGGFVWVWGVIPDKLEEMKINLIIKSIKSNKWQIINYQGTF